MEEEEEAEDVGPLLKAALERFQLTLSQREKVSATKTRKSRPAGLFPGNTAEGKSR